MDYIIKLNEQLMGLPSGVLIGVFAIALGYLLKSIPVIDNRYIPLIVVTFCTVAFMVIAPARTDDTAARIYHGRNFLAGAVIGFVAWTFHAQILRRWIDPKLFKKDQDQ